MNILGESPALVTKSSRNYQRKLQSLNSLDSVNSLNSLQGLSSSEIRAGLHIARMDYPMKKDQKPGNFLLSGQFELKQRPVQENNL